MGLLEEIPVSKNSDPIEEYAQFLLNSSKKGLTCLDNCEVLMNSYQKYIKKIKADGFIINQLTDCNINSNCYDLLKNKIRTELRVPSIGIKFKKIGIDIEPLKSKLVSFMELFG